MTQSGESVTSRAGEGHGRTPEGEGVRRLQGVAEVGAHAELRAAARDWQRYSSDLIGDVDIRDYRQLPLEVDPPEHGVYRKIMDPIFGRPQILSLEPQLRAVATRLAAGFREAGTAEAVSELALPMVVSSIGIAFGRQQDIDEYLSWGTDAWQTMPDGTRDGSRLHSYLERVFREVKLSPGADAFSVFATAEIDGRPMTHEELLGLGSIILSGGRDTVISLISGALWHLAQDDGARALLADDPQRIPTAVEEYLRYLSPLPAMERVVTEPVSGAWGEANTDDIVLLGFARANHDRAVFADPAAIDIERSPNRHVAFGNGPHTCIGLHLARLEARLLLDELLAATPDWRLGEGSEVTFGDFGDSRIPVFFGALPLEVA
jgi:cytochrome P450